MIWDVPDQVISKFLKTKWSNISPLVTLGLPKAKARPTRVTATPIDKKSVNAANVSETSWGFCVWKKLRTGQNTVE